MSMKFVGQALWVTEHGAAALHPLAPCALHEVLWPMRGGTVKLQPYPDTLFGELLKVRAMIHSVATPEPLLTYAKWYKRELERLQNSHGLLHASHASIAAAHGSYRCVVDIFGEIVLPTRRGEPERVRVLWIDVEVHADDGNLINLVTPRRT